MHEYFVIMITVSCFCWTHQHALFRGLKARYEQQREPNSLKNEPFSKSCTYFWNACNDLLEKKKTLISRAVLGKYF